MNRVVVALIAVVAAACAKGGGGRPDALDDGQSLTVIDASIDGNGCAVQPCSILPQCGCGGLNTCDVNSDGTGTACRNILTPGTETRTCTSSVGCDSGYTCIGGAAYASCKKYCMTDGDCMGPRGQCVTQQTNGGMPIPNVPRLCSSNCVPTDTTPEQCPSTFKCTLYTALVDGTSRKIADCSLAGTGTQGTDCTSGTQPLESKCAKGFQCTKVGSDTTYKCRKICTSPMANSSQCNNMQCIGFGDPHTIAGVTYGVCAP